VVGWLVALVFGTIYNSIVARRALHEISWYPRPRASTPKAVWPRQAWNAKRTWLPDRKIPA